MFGFRASLLLITVSGIGGYQLQILKKWTGVGDKFHVSASRARQDGMAVVPAARLTRIS